uniref:Uncharacterized protein n=1 Tax=Triticum urartu TaxID=4572 RepID=A0A8R7RAE8_TRIUA
PPRVPPRVLEPRNSRPCRGPPQLGPRHHHRLHGLVQEGHRRLHGRLQAHLVAHPWCEEVGDGVAAEGGVGDGGEVAADADVDRLALLESRGNGLVDLLVGVVEVVDDGLVARHRREAPQLLREIREADGVVKNPVGAVVVRVGRSGEGSRCTRRRWR